MFCEWGGQTKNFRPFCYLQNKMHYLNDVQDLWGGGQTNVCGVFGDGIQWRSS